MNVVFSHHLVQIDQPLASVQHKKSYRKAIIIQLSLVSAYIIQSPWLSQNLSSSPSTRAQAQHTRQHRRLPNHSNASACLASTAHPSAQLSGCQQARSSSHNTKATTKQCQNGNGSRSGKFVQKRHHARAFRITGLRGSSTDHLIQALKRCKPLASLLVTPYRCITASKAMQSLHANSNA